METLLAPLREMEEYTQLRLAVDKGETPVTVVGGMEAVSYTHLKTKGLLDEPELEGVTLMLSDNNQGAARTLPTKAMRNHKGGYGMYYHMDMHGGPMAFELSLIHL